MYQIIGIEAVSYTAKDGHDVNAKNLHLVYEKNSVDGNAVRTAFITNGRLKYFNVSEIKVGDIVQIYFDKDGKRVVYIGLVKSADKN